MKFSKHATSIVEAMIAIMIISVGVTGMYRMYTQSIRLSDSTENKLQAIQIAKEGIEAVSNIRDTNWLIYSADYKNCWNTLNYKPDCINDLTSTFDIQNATTSYIIWKGINNRWGMTPTSLGTGLYTGPTYRENFKVGLDTEGFYSQTGVIDNLQPIFTREIKFNYIETTDPADGINSNDEKVIVTSLVQWMDSASTVPHKVELNTTLSNWKNKKD